MGSDPTLSEADRALLDRLATRVVGLHMEVPAILTLETAKPLTLLASQTLVFFEPIIRSLFPIPDYRRLAALVERREALEALVCLIEDKAEARGRRGAGSRDRRGTGGDAPGPGRTG